MKTLTALTLAATSIFAATFSLQASSLLDAEAQKALANYNQSFKAVKTQAQLIKTYQQGQQLGQKLSQKLQVPFDKIQESGSGYDTFNTQLEAITKQFPGFRGLLVAEGTVVDFWPHYGQFAQAAQKTPEKADNDFFNLMIAAYGPDNGSFGLWFQQTWDYGGCTNLGDGQSLKLWQELARVRKAKSPFETELQSLQDDLWQTSLNYAAYCKDSKSVLTEFEQILHVIPAKLSSQAKHRLDLLKHPEKRKVEEVGQIGFNCGGDYEKRDPGCDT